MFWIVYVVLKQREDEEMIEKKVYDVDRQVVGKDMKNWKEN